MAALVTLNTDNQNLKSTNQPSGKTDEQVANGKRAFRVEIPKISSRDLRAQRAHSPMPKELDQLGQLLLGPGAKRDANEKLLKIRSSDLEESVKKARKYAMDQSVRSALAKQQQQQQRQQMDLLKRQQALLLMCRIYIGSIFYEVNEEQVKNSFGAFGPIRAITMSWDAATNKHKGFAFIEFETPEAAQLAYEQMNGALLGGRNIKVGRPSNMPQAQPIIDQMTEDSKHHHRIYVASIHPELSEQDVQSVFEAFGTIRYCNLVRDIQTGKHKGYGFIEFDNLQSALDAISSMNQFDLGGNLLRVGKAITPPDIVSSQANPTPAQLSASAAVTANLAAQMQDMGVCNSNAANLLNSASSVSSLSSKTSSSNLQASSVQNSSAEKVSSPITPVQEQVKGAKVSPASPASPSQVEAPLGNIELTVNQRKLLGLSSTTDDAITTLEQQSELMVKGKEQRMLLMQKLMKRRADSRIVILRNMVGPEDVDEELEVEITEECEKYGEVERVVIYQEKQTEDEDAEILVKIFVEFNSARSAEGAVVALNGRYFAGRIVKAETYDEAAFVARDLSG